MKSQAQFESPLLSPAPEADDLCCYGKGREREGTSEGGFLRAEKLLLLQVSAAAAAGEDGVGRRRRRIAT